MVRTTNLVVAMLLAACPFAVADDLRVVQDPADGSIIVLPGPEPAWDPYVPNHRPLIDIPAPHSWTTRWTLPTVPAVGDLLPRLDPQHLLHQCQAETFFSAWLSQGVTYNPDQPRDRFNGPMTFNDRANEYQLNQLYFAFGRDVGHSHDWDVGGRVDFLIGSDYFFVQATGLETRPDGSPHWNSGNGPRGTGASRYGIALPQLYAEVYSPVGNGMSLKVGHFYSLLGYETAAAPENFFYSHTYARQYGEPMTHAGVLLTYRPDQGIVVHGGITRGWDTWEDPNDKFALLGGANWTSTGGKTMVDFAFHTGREDPAGQNTRSSYSLVLASRWLSWLEYVIQHDFGIEEDAVLQGSGNRDDAKWYGIVQYLFLRMSETAEAGLRFEWFRDQDNARVMAVPIETLSDGGNYYALALGVNYHPFPQLLFRPEVRWDWSNASASALGINGMFDDFSDTNQFVVATDVVLVY